jgi:hypothetical protein
MRLCCHSCRRRQISTGDVFQVARLLTIIYSSGLVFNTNSR